MRYGLSALDSTQDGALNNERDRCCRPFLVRELSLSKSFLGQTISTTDRAQAHQGQEDKTRQIRAKDLEKGSSKNYLGGEHRTRLVDVLDSYRKLQSL
jgi:hypothetical protein